MEGSSSPYQAMLMLSPTRPDGGGSRLEMMTLAVDTAEICCISVFFFHVSLGVYIQYIYIYIF